MTENLPHDVNDRPIPPQEALRAEMRAQVEREMAQFEQLDRITTLRPRCAGQAGASVVFSLRLDRDELRALERRAALTDIKPTVLARSLIRTGLSTRHSAAIARAVDQLEEAVRELRALVP